MRQSSRFLPGTVQVRRLPGPLLEGLPPARYPVSKTVGPPGLGGSTPSPSPRGGMAELARHRVATAQAALCRSQVRVLLPPLPFRRGRDGKTRGCYPRDRRFEPCRRSLTPPWSKTVMTPGPQPGSCGFEGRRGYLVGLLAVGELATPPASGAGDRRFDSCQPDLRGRGAAVLASLMSSRSWVRIPPALPLGGVAQTSRALACQARGRRFESGRPRFVFMVAVV
jgi:hypothetical protein